MCSTINSVSPVFWLDCLYITSLYRFSCSFCVVKVCRLSSIPTYCYRQEHVVQSRVQSSFLFSHFRKEIWDKCTVERERKKRSSWASCSVLPIKYHKMNVLISKVVTNSSEVPSWADCRESEMTPLHGCGSLDAIGLYINNQTHSVVFIMCAKCLLCYFKSL